MSAFFLRLLLTAVLLVPGSRCVMAVQSGPVPAKLWRSGGTGTHAPWAMPTDPSYAIEMIGSTAAPYSSIMTWDASRVFAGPTTITVDAPLDTIPVFVRAGADVPGRP